MADVVVAVPSGYSRPRSAQSTGSADDSRGVKFPLPVHTVMSTPGIGTAVLSSASDAAGSGVPNPATSSLHPLSRFVQRTSERIAASKQLRRSRGGRTGSSAEPAVEQRAEQDATMDAAAALLPEATRPGSSLKHRASRPPSVGSSGSSAALLRTTTLEFDVSAYVRNESANLSRSIDRSKLISPLPCRGVCAGGASDNAARSVSRATTPQEWIRDQRPLLDSIAIPVSPAQSPSLSAIPRTLADRAIRLSGYRAAATLARAFEVAPSPQQIVDSAGIRWAAKLV